MSQQRNTKPDVPGVVAGTVLSSSLSTLKWVERRWAEVRAALRNNGRERIVYSFLDGWSAGGVGAACADQARGLHLVCPCSRVRAYSTPGRDRLAHQHFAGLLSVTDVTQSFRLS